MPADSFRADLILEPREGFLEEPDHTARCSAPLRANLRRQREGQPFREEDQRPGLNTLLSRPLPLPTPRLCPVLVSD